MGSAVIVASDRKQGVQVESRRIQIHRFKCWLSYLEVKQELSKRERSPYDYD